MWMVSAGFRWCKPAAPLKRDAEGRIIGCRALGFRWCKPAAPLKRDAEGRIIGCRALGFRWCKPAAPLKLPADRVDGPGDGRASAGVNQRPH